MSQSAIKYEVYKSPYLEHPHNVLVRKERKIDNTIQGYTWYVEKIGLDGVISDNF